MKKSAILMILAASSLAVTAISCGDDCGDGCVDVGGIDSGAGDVEVPTDVSSDLPTDVGIEHEVSINDCLSNEYGDPIVMMNTYRVVSFNVMCSVCDMSYDPWEDRLTYFGDIFDRLQPDLVGLQEFILADEVTQILAEMPGYSAVFYKGDDVNYFAYPDAAVMYKTARFDLVESGEYWLSPTPDVPWSMGYSEGQTIPRVVVWVHLRDKEAHNKDIYFATTHYDSTHPHQEKSAPQMITTTEPWAARMPVIQTGDFNTEPRDPAYNILTNGIDASGFHFDDAFNGEWWESQTNQEVTPAYDPMNRIDHILTAGGAWATSSWNVDLYKFGDGPMFPSDHRLIWADVEVARELNCL